MLYLVLDYQVLALVGEGGGEGGGDSVELRVLGGLEGEVGGGTMPEARVEGPLAHVTLALSAEWGSGERSGGVVSGVGGGTFGGLEQCFF